MAPLVSFFLLGSRMKMPHLLMCIKVTAGFTFLAVGDWGGQDTKPYTEVGQVATAKGMGNVAEQVGAKFVLALGDNFYSNGIETNANVRIMLCLG